MAAALWTYTLPTLQLVCHLVPTGNTSISVTTPGKIEPPFTTSSLLTDYPPSTTSSTPSLPTDYPSSTTSSTPFLPTDYPPSTTSSTPSLPTDDPPSTTPSLPTDDPPSTTPSLPIGYIAYPDLGFAYKVFDEFVTWNVAKDRCTRDGADLAVIDSTAKIDVVMTQWVLPEPAHLGFYLGEDDDTNWYSLSTGLPVSNLPWASREPNGRGRCIMLKNGLYGLGKYDCATPGPYVCQIQYP